MTIGLLPSYSCKMHILTRQLILMQVFFVIVLRSSIQFEIGFIEEMRTTCGNKEVPQTFFYNSEVILFAKIRFNPFG